MAANGQQCLNWLSHETGQAQSPILGLILHGVLQVLPNKISGGDNTYGCK